MIESDGIISFFALVAFLLWLKGPCRGSRRQQPEPFCPYGLAHFKGSKTLAVARGAASGGEFLAFLVSPSLLFSPSLALDKRPQGIYLRACQWRVIFVSSFSSPPFSSLALHLEGLRGAVPSSFKCPSPRLW